MRTAFPGLLLCLAAALASPSACAELRVSPLPFEAPGAAQPSVAADAREGFVLTWQERREGLHSLQYAVLAPDGAERRRGRIAQGQGWFANWADFPNLTVLENGDWVTFWLQKSGDSTYAYDIHLVRSTDAGRSWSEGVVPHGDGTQTEHGFVSLVPLEGDRVLAIWLDGRRGAGAAPGHEEAGEAGMSLRSAVFGRDGVPREERELDELTCSCCQTSAARVGSEVLVAYRDRTREEIRDMAWLRRDARGRWSQPRRLHADNWKIAGCPVNGPALAANGNAALVLWPTLAQEPMRVRASLGGAKGFRAPIEIEAGADVLGRVHAAAWREGGFLMSWIGAHAGQPALKLAHLDRDAKLVEQRVVQSAEAGRSSGNPRMASLRDRALLAWPAHGGVRLALVSE